MQFISVGKHYYFMIFLNNFIYLLINFIPTNGFRNFPEAFRFYINKVCFSVGCV